MSAWMLVDFRESGAQAQTSRWRSTSMIYVPRSYSSALVYTQVVHILRQLPLNRVSDTRKSHKILTQKAGMEKEKHLV